MEQYYYSTQPFLAWCLSHYFYDGIHFAFIGSPFHPYRRPNPASSDPLSLFQKLYRDWMDEDIYSCDIAPGTSGLLSTFVGQKRIGLRKGVKGAADRSKIDPRTASKLNTICERGHVFFFYPIVYRVNKAALDEKRFKPENSATVGSNEFTIVDLDESKKEFDILFVDLEIEFMTRRDDGPLKFGPIKADVKRLWDEQKTLSKAQTLNILYRHIYK